MIDEDSTAVIATLDSPTALHCYAVGWPRPIVTWWRADKMLPMTSDLYEQRPDHSLVIQMVTVDVLGPYTCQAYNGQGRAASWSVTLQARGRGHSDNPYVLPPSRHPATGESVRLKPIVIKLTRRPPIYRPATQPQVDFETTTQPAPPTPQKVFSGKKNVSPPPHR